jgi:hypothetical protein
MFDHRETVPQEEPEEVPMPKTVPAEPEPAPAPEEEPEPAPLPEEEPTPSPEEPAPIPAEPDKELVPAGVITPQLKALFEISERALALRYFVRFDNQFLVKLLSELLGRQVYSEKAGILPEAHSAVVSKRPEDNRIIQMLGWDEEVSGYIVGEELFFMGLPAVLEAFGMDKQKPMVMIATGRDAEEKLHRYNQENRLSKGKLPVLAALNALEAVRLVQRELAQREVSPRALTRLQGLLSPGDLKWEETLLRLQVEMAPPLDQKKFDNVVKLSGLADLVETFRAGLRIQQAA